MAKSKRNAYGGETEMPNGQPIIMQMIDWNERIETTAGWPAKVVSRDYKTPKHVLYLVQMERPGGLSIVGWYHADGRPRETEPILRNVPKKREAWVRVGDGVTGLVLVSQTVYPDKETAKAACVVHGGLVALITLEGED
jgi:hypothetical protein